MVDIVIRQLDGSAPLVIERAERLAEGFFRLDPSSTRPDGLDAMLGLTPPNEITPDDVHTINRTFVARSPMSAWEDLFRAGPLPWLAALDPAWDLLALDESEWAGLRCHARLEEAIDAIRAPGGVPAKYRGAAVTTKLLHLKRPRLVPVCDSFVVKVTGASESLATIDLVEHLRREGRANLAALRTVQQHLSAQGIERTLVRILDALLWSSHPDSLTHPLIGLIRDWTERAGPTSYH